MKVHLNSTSKETSTFKPMSLEFKELGKRVILGELPNKPGTNVKAYWNLKGYWFINAKDTKAPKKSIKKD